MKQDFIQKFKKARPNKRAKVLTDMRDKNVAYLEPRNPELAKIVMSRGGNYNINIESDFFQVTDRTVGKLCHPPGRLEEYMGELGAWHHTGWIDKIKIAPRIIPNIDHGVQVIKFLQTLYQQMPEIPTRIQKGVVSLPRLPDKRCFSGITVFLGTFIGLHIINYLNRTEIRNLVIIEPDLDRFALSCFFVDYEAIERRFKSLVMHVGPNMPENTVNFLIGKAHVTGSAWLRLLPAYPSQDFERLINRFELQWRGLSEIFVPYDREVRNLCYGVRNIESGLPINYKRPELSSNSRMALVASGPSLDNEIAWLKANQDKLIILAAHSAVYTLLQNGIRPDYQCSLDTELSEELIEKLHLDFDIPFISYYKATPESLTRFNKVLLVNEVGKANPILFKSALSHTHPTTGNLTLATIIFAQPKQLFLVGLDLGFRDANRDHATGYWDSRDQEATDTPDEANTGKAKPTASQGGIILGEANFADSEGQIYTKSYYNSARAAVEAGLTVLPNTEIFNLSDGIKLKGAEPKHSTDLVLTDYPEKAADIAIFEASFSSSHDDDDFWRPYKTPGAELLEEMRNALRDAVTLKKFDWISFSESLDRAWEKVFIRIRQLEPDVFDIRIEAYSKLIQDLLTEWYRSMIFTKNPKESEKLYRAGIEALMTILEELEWPQELVEFEQRYLAPEADTGNAEKQTQPNASETDMH